MAKPYSGDLRAQVDVAVCEGYTVREVAALLASALSQPFSVGSICASGSAATTAVGGSRRDGLAEHKDWLRNRITVMPDLKLDALVAELAERGQVVGRRAV